MDAGFAVITGGGPGAMEAANKGASEAGGVSVGLGIELPLESGLNEWADVGINFRYFFARKTMFVKYSQGFVVLPGRLRHPRRAVRGAHAGADQEGHPVPDRAGRQRVLGRPAVLAAATSAMADGKISQADLEMLVLTDDLDEAVQLMVDARESR